MAQEEPNVVRVWQTPITRTVKQAAADTGLSTATIRLAINKKHLPAKRVGTTLLIRVTDLEQRVDSLEDAR